MAWGVGLGVADVEAGFVSGAAEFGLRCDSTCAHPAIKNTAQNEVKRIFLGCMRQSIQENSEQ
jgi:hypothetical protein